MSYNKYTKFKINKLVAEHLGMETNKELLSDFVLSNDYNERYPDTVWARPEGQPWGQFCFTNEPEGWGKLQEAVGHVSKHENVNNEDIARISPLMTRHINMLGQYSFNVSPSILQGERRPLYLAEES